MTQPLHNFVLGSSGISGLMDKFLREMNDYLHSPDAKDEVKTWKEFSNLLENIASALFDRYRQRLEDDEISYDFDVLYCAKTFERHASLYHMYRNGYSNEVKDYDVTGHGEPIAIPFLKSIYHRDLTMAEAIRLCVFILKLINEENIDVSVGGKPQIFIIPDDGDARELSEGEIDNLVNKYMAKNKLENAIFS
jgi:20S proteasome alpha/beta subunit